MKTKKVKITNPKKRSNSSRRWLERQLNDPYVDMAKKEGFRSRAAFKLQEIQEKYKIITPNSLVVDLGAAPGGWTQVVKRLSSSSKIYALDLQDFESINGTHSIIGDFTEESTFNELMTLLNGQKVDVVLSDMAPAACGINSVDHDRIMMLLELVYDFAQKALKKHGHMIAKVLRGGTEDALLFQLKKNFKKVYHFKPKSSRKESSEMYVIALDYQG